MIRKPIVYSLKSVSIKTMFTLNIAEILLFEGRSVLGPAQRVPESEKVITLDMKFHGSCDLKKYALLFYI